MVPTVAVPSLVVLSRANERREGGERTGERARVDKGELCRRGLPGLHKGGWSITFLGLLIGAVFCRSKVRASPTAYQRRSSAAGGTDWWARVTAKRGARTRVMAVEWSGTDGFPSPPSHAFLRLCH